MQAHASNPSTDESDRRLAPCGLCPSFVEYSFSDLVVRNIREDEEYLREHLACALETFLEGDSVTAQLMLRDFVKGTIGFEELGRRLGKSPKSLMRMLSARGNPRAGDLSAIIATLMRLVLPT